MNPLRHWHNLLNMPKNDLEWHQKDLADELVEYQEAKGFIDSWSELSDISYTYSRANWSGHELDLPIPYHFFLLGLIYMIPKYSLRWRFFRKLGYKFNKNLHINEVRNPRKVHRLHTIAEKHNINPLEFEMLAKKQLEKSFLLR